jgi:ABC-type lipoprotein release transport system permease subunit
MRTRNMLLACVLLLIFLGGCAGGYYGAMHNSYRNYGDTLIIKNSWGITVYRQTNAIYEYREGCLVVYYDFQRYRLFCPQDGYTWEVIR